MSEDIDEAVNMSVVQMMPNEPSIRPPLLTFLYEPTTMVNLFSLLASRMQPAPASSQLSQAMLMRHPLPNYGNLLQHEDPLQYVNPSLQTSQVIPMRCPLQNSNSLKNEDPIQRKSPMQHENLLQQEKSFGDEQPLHLLIAPSKFKELMGEKYSNPIGFTGEFTSNREFGITGKATSLGEKLKVKLELQKCKNIYFFPRFIDLLYLSD